MENRCVICGEIIPEGRQVCPSCENGHEPKCCKNCALQECKGRNGYIVCDIDGEDHEPDFVCRDYEQESNAK